MEKRRLGKSGPLVSALGLGCMGMSFAYGPADEGESLRVLHRYLQLGGNFLDTAEIYGPYTNEELLGRFLREVPRDSVVIATKFGFRFNPSGVRGVDSSPENVRRACDGSLKRLGIETIDLFYQHRVDPKVPIEDTVGAMAGLVSAGKVRALGLSEAGPETLRRAGKKGSTPAQLALGWVLAQGKDLIPIPGTKRVRYLEDNMGALSVKLTESDLKEIGVRLAQIEVVGERYAPDMMALVNHA